MASLRVVQRPMAVKRVKMGIRIRTPISQEHLETGLRSFCARPFAIFQEPAEEVSEGSLFTVLFEDDDDRTRFIEFRRGEMGRAP